MVVLVFVGDGLILIIAKDAPDHDRFSIRPLMRYLDCFVSACPYPVLTILRFD